jgi:hypothetical protein
MVVLLFTFVFLPVGFLFYKHLLCFYRNWILSCSLYVIYCVCEVQLVW